MGKKFCRTSRTRTEANENGDVMVLAVFKGIHQIREPSFDKNYKLGLGMYLLAEGEVAIIDSGIAASPSNCIIPYLTEANLPAPSLVINTHGHEDHVGGNWELKTKYNSKIAIHMLDAPWAEDPDLFFKEFFAQYPQYLPPTEEVRLTVYAERGKGCRVDFRLGDGEKLEAGGRELQVIHTPGHSAGSICLYDEDHRILFSGDAFQGRGINTEASPDLPMYVDLPAYIGSLKRVSQMPIDTMFTAHEFKPFKSMVLTGNEAKVLVSESLKAVDEIEVEILSLIRKKPFDLFDLAKVIRAKFAGPGISTQALGSVEAHLRKLTGEGKAELVESSGKKLARVR